MIGQNDSSRARAMRVLALIRERTEFSPEPVMVFDLASSCGLSRSELEAAWCYLRDRDLINVFTLTYAAKINANGIDALDSEQRSLRDDRRNPKIEIQKRPATAANHIVLLIHGIRDFALYQSELRVTLEQQGFGVESLNYGRMNLLQFLFPISYFRNRAIEQIHEQIRIVEKNNPEAQLSVIAHSFGTHVIAMLLRTQFDLKFHRVVFCGSVVRYGFPFQQFSDRYTQPILNEVGTRDVWPAMAESLTFGYGAAGTYGFRRPLTRDRWHNGAAHGFFLNSQFCTKFWVPFLKDGTIVLGDSPPEAPRGWVPFISIFKIKYVLLVIALIFGWFMLTRETEWTRSVGVESSRQAFPGIRGDLVELSDHGRATATIKVKPSDIDREAKVDAIATGQNKGNGGCLSVVVTGLTMACESDVQHPSTTGFITAHADCPSLTIRAGSARTFTAHLVENKGFACGAFDAPTVDLTVSFAGKVQ